MAPEVLDEKPYDLKADIYRHDFEYEFFLTLMFRTSFAIVLWELVTAKIPYDDNGFASGPRGLFREFHLQSHLFSNPNFVATELLQFVVAGKRLEIPNDCPAPLGSLIQKCWDAVPANRPSFADVLASHVLDDGKFQCLTFVT